MFKFKKHRLYEMINDPIAISAGGALPDNYYTPDAPPVPADGSREAPVTDGSVPADGETPADETAPRTDGEAPPPTDEGGGEATILADNYDYSTDDSTSRKTTSLPDTTDSATMAPDDQQTWSTYDDLVKRAAEGDTEAQTLLDQWDSGNQLAQQTEDLQEQMEQSRFVDEEGSSDQEQLYEKAVSQEALLKMMEKRARDAAGRLPRNSPLRETLIKQADQFAAQRKQFAPKVRAFEQRLEDAKRGDMQKQYTALVQKKQAGTLTAEEKKVLRQYEGRFGSFKAGEAELYQKKLDKKTAHETDKKRSEIEKETKKDFKRAEKEAKKEIKEKEEVLARETVPEPGDAEVEQAERTVASRLGQDQVEKNKEKASKRAAFLAWAREKKGEIESGEATGDSAMAYSVLYSAGLAELTGSGKKGQVAGLKFLTGGTARQELDSIGAHGDAPEAVGAQLAVPVPKQDRAATILSAQPGDEDFDKNRAALNALYQQPSVFRGDDEDGGRGLFRFFAPWSAGRLQGTRGLSERRA